MSSNGTPQPAGRWVILACSSKGCGAPIIWARTKAGSRMPVDAYPHPDGRWRLLDDGGPEPALVYGRTDPTTIAAQLAGTPVPLHHSHFATCTQAAQFRTGRGR